MSEMQRDATRPVSSPRRERGLHDLPLHVQGKWGFEARNDRKWGAEHARVESPVTAVQKPPLGASLSPTPARNSVAVVAAGLPIVVATIAIGAAGVCKGGAGRDECGDDEC